jgi:hypothetical protein
MARSPSATSSLGSEQLAGHDGNPQKDGELTFINALTNGQVAQ